MTLGQRILNARKEAGMSQRELAGDVMTRNMLSALEHDGANPSLSTIRYLADRLNKPISYLMGESVISGAEAEKIEQARRSYRSGAYRACITYTEEPAGVFQQEASYLRALSFMELAREAIQEERLPYAKELLEQARTAGELTVYFGQVQREWILLMAQAGEKRYLIQLTQEDVALVLRAEQALDKNDLEQAAMLLEAVRNRDEKWQYLRGEVYFRKMNYELAAQCYHAAEEKMADKTRKKLELCYKELGDYKMAYHYATKAKEDS